MSQIELCRSPQQAARKLAPEKMIETREGTDRIAKPRRPGFERVGDYECHLRRIARHSRGVCIACPEHMLHPCMIGAIWRLNAWGAVPDLSAIRAGLDEDDVNPKRLELVGDRLGPTDGTDAGHRVGLRPG